MIAQARGFVPHREITQINTAHLGYQHCYNSAVDQTGMTRMSATVSKRLAYILPTLLLVLVAAVAYSYFLLASSVSRNFGTEDVDGISAPVDIRFDELQRPFVSASTLDDAFFAQGWLHASERLWQMETLRRAGNGRLAQLMGRELLETDRELWRFGVPQLARSLEDKASPELLDTIDSYIGGINASIDYHPKLPPEFLVLRQRPAAWQRGDVFALAALMAFQSGNNFRNETLRLGLLNVLGGKQFGLFLRDHSQVMDYPYIIDGEHQSQQVPVEAAVAGMDVLSSINGFNHTDPSVNPRMPRLGFGSNSWVVAPGKSATGNALLAFDSHDTLGVPNLFYQVHLFYGEGRSLQGWSVAGLPGVISGYNERIAWGFTNIGDSQDLFLENRSPDNPLLFKDGDDWYEAKVETVTIPVRGQADSQLHIVHTRNGPLVSTNPPLALSWTAHHLGALGLEGLLAINTARNWQEFNAALDRLPAPTLNAIYADIEGNIGFRSAGLLPIRGQGNGQFPLRGDLPENRWQGWVDASQMPRLLNPVPGFIAAANARVSPNGGGPLVSADNAAPYRMQRLQNYLSRMDKIDATHMQELQLDWLDNQALMLLPQMTRELDISLLSQSASYAAGLLLEWQVNPVASPDSGAAIIFQHWYLGLARTIFQPAMGSDLFDELKRRNYVLNQAVDSLILDASLRGWWPEDRSTTLSQTLNRSIESLGKLLGPDMESWRLDQLQGVALEHELASELPVLGKLFNCARQPWGGTPATVGRASYGYDQPYRVSHGATVRAVAEMSDPPQVFSVIPGGQSGHPLSEHYCDQFSAWLGGELFEVRPPDSAHQLRLAPTQAATAQRRNNGRSSR